MLTLATVVWPRLKSPSQAATASLGQAQSTVRLYNPAPPRQPKNNQTGKSCGLKNPLPRSSQARAPPNMLRYARPGMDCVILRALLKSLKSLSVKLDEKERLQHDLTQA